MRSGEGACTALARLAPRALLRALPSQPTSGLSNVMLFAHRLPCSQAASYSNDPAAGQLIIGTNFAVLKFAMKDTVGRCAAGRGRPRSELHSELVRGRQRRARGRCPHMPRLRAGAVCARPQTSCVRMRALYYAVLHNVRHHVQQSRNRCVRVVCVPSQVYYYVNPSYSPLCAPMPPAPITCAPLGRASVRD